MTCRLAFLVAVASLAAACSSGPPHVVALVSAPPGLSSPCVVVEMTGADARSPFDTVVTRDPGQDALKVAVYQQDWPKDVSLEAFIPASCGAPPFARLAHSPVQPVTFESTPREVPLDIPDPSPAALAFVGLLGTVEAGACSPPVELQVQDAQGAPALIASSLVTVSLSAAPDLGLQLYIDDACSMPASQVVIGPSPSAPVRVRGAAVGSAVVSANAAGLTSAQTPVTVVAGPPAQVAVLSPPQTLLSGDCSATVVMELRDVAGNPSPARSNLPVTVQMPAAAPGFYSDALCTTALTALTIPTGSTQATATFRPYTPGTATLTATAGSLTPGTQQEVTVPIVRRGTCGIPEGMASVSCPVSPAPLQRNRAFVLFQATNNVASPSDAQVRCALANPPTALNCFRDPAGGMVGAVTIHWSVVELAYAKVQHVSLNCGNNPALPVSRLNLNQPVNLSQAFLVYSFMSIGGGYADDFRAGHFEDGGTSVLFENEVSDCRPDWVYNAQAVELTNGWATVDRGTATTDAGIIAVTGLPNVDRNRSFLLYSWGTSLASGNAICDRMVMGEMDSDNTLKFSIGNGVAACQTRPTLVAWERVQLRVGIVQSPSITMNATELSKSVNVGTSYNNSRTVAFTGGQAAGGQGDGQCSYSSDDMAAECIARISLGGGTNLSLQRDSADAGAKWQPFVVEFQP
ncbi:MAG TPA: hypothetical protein VFA20_33480 [Myxococcaceae bacterium]|nr:hypothetical protein [Myxococcaceae bacterium]